MRTYFWLVSLLCLMFSCTENDAGSQQELPAIEVNYPDTRTDSTVDEYHGTVVADPYRWLEDDNSEETKDWVNRQNEVTFSYLDQIPYRELVRKRLEEVWNYERYGTPFKRGDRYYFFKNDGLQNQSVLYGQESLDAPAHVILDPNTFSEDGTVSLASISFNKEGSLLAYQISRGGSDWRTIFVKNLESGNLLADSVQWVKFSGISWKDEGFFYSRFPEPTEDDRLSGSNSYHKVYYHKLGTNQEDDEVVIGDDKHPQRNFFSTTTDDEKFLTVSSSESTSGNALKIKNLDTGEGFKNVVDRFDNDFDVIDNVEEDIYVMTNYKAPKGRLIAIPSQDPTEGKWREIIPEGSSVLRSVDLVGSRLLATYLIDAKSEVKVFDFEGIFQQDLELPAIGSVGGFSGKKGDSIAFYTFSSFTFPSTIFKLDLSTLVSEPFKVPEIEFDQSQYTTEQVFFTSKDGTRVPMFLTYRKDIDPDQPHPTMLYAYGGFNVSITPGFNPSTLIWLENGGIYAVPNIRGGGEYGKEWHLAGTKERKQNVFDDFIAAAEYLIEEGYTSSEKLSIMGGSNGGLLVGACMTQRPDLYKVAIPRVGVLDMLRYHEFTIGWAWAEDYGRSDDPSAFEYLYKYSPLHNLKPANYPATLVMTADHDDRVVPAHSFKFVSELQKQHQGSNPVLIRIETSAGHGAGKPTSKIIEENADMWSFILYNMNEDVLYKNLDS
ncbi:MAG: prolyl oligopeptidase family serine peptidase, partial [Saprospiraceae bacterium]|nr:prolyl oligopeptidase family serine peptidase [Saprospiraceae bacterium]